MNKKYFINSIIVVLIMSFFRFIPPFGQMTSMGMTILGIFIGALWGWIKCDMIWPSVLGMVLLGFTGYTKNVAEVFTMAISNPTIQMMLWLLVFSAILNVSGISKQLANRLISSKMCKGRPWVLSAFIFFAAMLGAAFGAIMAAILICWDFIYSISEQVGYTAKDKWPKMMIVSVIFATSLGGVILPFQVGVTASYGYLFAASEGAYTAYNYMAYLGFSTIIALTTSALYFICLKFVIRPDVLKLKENIQVGVIEDFSEKQKIAVGALVAMIVFTILPSCIPDCWIKTVLNNMGTTAIILIIVVVVTFLRDKEGKQFFTFKELADAGIFWPMMFMVATAVVMGTALASKDSGFTATLLGFFTPIFSKSGSFAFALAICVVTLFLTNIINNAVAGAIMIPVMYSFAANANVNPLMMTALICFASNIGMLLPCASPAGAMLHSNREWVQPLDIIKVTVLGLISLVLIFICIGIPLGSVMF